MSSLGCPIMAAVPAASGCQQAVFAQLQRGTHTPAGNYPNREITKSEMTKSFVLCHSFGILCQSGSDHWCFVIMFNETDQSSDFAIFASPSFSRDETDIAARSHHVRQNNLQRNPPASVQSPCAS